EMTKTMADTLKQAVPSLVVSVIGQNGSDNVLVNHKKPPFDNPSVRRAVSLAMDRYAYVQGVRHNGAIVGAALMPPPQGTWGLPERERKLLAAADVTPAKPLRIELTTRNIAIYVDLASFVADQLRLVGIEATVKQVDTAQYFPALVRREFQLGANLTASGIDDPDGYLYEN